MKKLNTIIFMFIIFFFISYCEINLLAQGFDGDLGLDAEVSSSGTITVTLEASSIPFEGRLDVKGLEHRVGELLNGSNHVIFAGNSNPPNINDTISYPIYYHQKTINTPFSGRIIELYSSIELPKINKGAWGYARYKITFVMDFTNPNKDDERYTFYFNSLDSKYSKENYPPYPPALQYWSRYSADWYICYYETGETNKVTIVGNRVSNPIIHYETFGEVYTWDVDPNGNPTKEFKVWEMLGTIGGWTTQWRKEFYVRSTPFPVNQYTAAHSRLRVFTLGTKVVLNGVYSNTGIHDRFGYNTQNNPYYIDPPIPPGNNDPGNTYCTPAEFSSHHQKFGIKLTAESGDTMILKNNKKLWISGQYEVGNGDTIHFETNSTLILEPNSGIFPTRGGVLINEGANVVWYNPSWHRVFDRSELYYKGNNTVNNGGSVIIDGNAYLRLGDNTTLTFDGTGSISTA